MQQKFKPLSSYIREVFSKINIYYLPGAHEYAAKLVSNDKRFDTVLEFFENIEQEIDDALNYRDTEKLGDKLSFYEKAWMKLFERMALQKYDENGIEGITMKEYRMFPVEHPMSNIKLDDKCLYDLLPNIRNSLLEYKEYPVWISSKPIKYDKKDRVYFSAFELIELCSKLTKKEDLAILCYTKVTFDNATIDTTQTLKRI